EVKEKNYNLVLVTNEIGSSLVPESHIGRVFRDIQGRVNQRIASVSDEVYLVCCGMPVKIK
ncbi:bifunctional adenosylcobinamide kinase/adenosylcobinamide-phosphate guanylyltransferase, partial [Anaerosalibacter bizertensis]|nr:bifunctional adenosylcobinamide kinase/adenosylcobinamide-phosphate guanylyltransferase [Anaerosalibacter bizertensis]